MKRSILLALFLAITLSGIYILPKFRVTDSAMNLEIPERLGPWMTQTFQPSEKERTTLAADTVFSKAHCGLRRYEEASLITGEAPMDIAELSIVLSGEDLTNSIHRPERCMAAQGHEIYDSQVTPITFPDGRTVPTRRLLSVQTVEDKDQRKFSNRCLTYYFFVGHERITSEHSERNQIDMKDRLFKGEAQHWAYVLVTIPFGQEQEVQHGGPLLALESADKKVKDLLARFTEGHIAWDQLKNSPPAAPTTTASLR